MNNGNNQTNNVVPPQNNGVTPTPQAPVQPQTVQSQVVQPQQVAQPVQQQVVQPQPAMPQPTSPQVVMPTSNNQEQVVINTTKKKTSNFILIILLVLLVFFVMNIDTVITYYDNYKRTGSIKGNPTENTDNLINGYILIGDSNGSIRIDDINYYNFKKSGTTISFNFESMNIYENSSDLGTYVEIYNSEKELLYKEQFKVDYKIEKNSVRIFNIEVDNYTATEAYYALVKKYTDEEKNKSTTMVCTLVDESVNYKNTYNFVNNSLISYSVSKELLDNDASNKAEIEKEYNSIKNYITTSTYQNNKLEYSVDLNNVSNELNPLYLYGTTPKLIKVKEELKKWKCE